MEYRKLGSTGIKIAPLVLGTMQMGWRVEEEESFKIMDRALELGINCFDTADVYSYWAENSYPGKTEEIILTGKRSIRSLLFLKALNQDQVWNKAVWMLNGHLPIWGWQVITGRGTKEFL